ncbi:magnesium transporter CorA family protein [Acinetobacter puyangensis]|uniref:Mg2+ and Co2+ transporter CorA n=1 Tax=Acinetobacter puyangensis TaxID=1096779 RepID=A0A240E6P7_9GAMM|nr:magnesium transporter CorA family protein [Acinetobacter puyangensis]SNX44434.1 Mg2+ and Co2+ transporter CorA [Acinetobacter puyangensis]
MKQYYFYIHSESQTIFLSSKPLENKQLVFVWLECTLEDLVHPEQWQQQVYEKTHLMINEYHIEDICNIDHPSNYDTTEDYDLLIFRKLVTPEDGFAKVSLPDHDEKIKTFNPSELLTTPMSFCISPSYLISIRDTNNLATKQYVDRLNNMLNKDISQLGKNIRLPSSPLDLTLRLLNIVIDRYLDIRLPLTQRVTFWQNQLLQSSARFTQWQDLFQENMALQQIEYLCEEQIDVLQELRDDIMENQSQLTGEFSLESQDITLVRVHDLLSHVERVQKHVSRLEAMIKTAIDLHFSAIANQTNENMRILAIITAIFSPLTLLTGIYGMNFEVIPGLKNPYGFWLMVMTMILTTLILMYIFRRKRLMGTSQRSITELLSQNQSLDIKNIK